MKSLIVFLLLFATLSFATDIRGNASIAGYQSGEFAVKGVVEHELNQRVIVPLSAKLPKTGNAQIKIFVTGYADRTGGGALNDRLAKSRAEEVAAFLSEKFPTAKIVALSKGDEADTKMVFVRWTATLMENPSTTVAATNRAAMSTGTMLCILSVAFGIGLLAYLTVSNRRSKARTASAKQEILEMTAPQTNLRMMPTQNFEPEPEIENVDLVVNGISYSVPIVHQETSRGKKWCLPFTTQENPDACQTRETKGNAIQAVKSCLKNPYYQLEIEHLVAAGKIKERKIV